MSFWSTSTGEKATGEVKENDFKPIPKGWYKQVFESIEIKDSVQYGKSINLKARIQGPTNANRAIFTSLKPWDANEKKSDRAKNVLVAMYNAVGVALPKAEPDETSLDKLCNKSVEALYDVYEFENDKGEKIDGNWLVNVRGSSAKEAKKSEPKMVDAEDDPIPF